MRKFLRFWLPPILYSALIIILSNLSKPPIPFKLESNLLHYPEYALFSFLLLRALHSGRREKVSLKNTVLALVFSIIFGMLDEFHQAFVPERVPELQDLLRDGIGAAIGILLFLLFNYVVNINRKGKEECQAS
ncbi:MAG: VanZ family protein [Acidobacteria bacterium]|nr:VanZ family protein [Acidobacteriota bacterium]